MLEIKEKSETIAEKLKKVRKEFGLTQKELARLLKCSERTIQNWEKGEVQPRRRKRKKIEEVLDTLLGERDPWEEVLPFYISSPSIKAQLRSVMSRIPAGYPSFVPSPADVEEALFLPQDLEGMLIVRVEGDSMSPLLQDREYVVVKPVLLGTLGELVGKVVVASVDGEYTIKRLKREKKKYYLVPENPEYEPIPVSRNTHIIGIVVEAISRRKIR